MVNIAEAIVRTITAFYIATYKVLHTVYNTYIRPHPENSKLKKNKIRIANPTKNLNIIMNRFRNRRL